MGETYIYEHKDYLYTGCLTGQQPPEAAIIAIDGIHYSMEFYPSDYSKFNPLSPEETTALLGDVMGGAPIVTFSRCGEITSVLLGV